MSDTIIKQQESDNGKYRITIHPDYHADSPCTAWDLGASYLFESSDCKCLHSDCSWRDIWNSKHYDGTQYSLKQALSALIEDYVSSEDMIAVLKKGLRNYKIQYNRSARQWEAMFMSRQGWVSDGFIGTASEILDDAFIYLDMFDTDELIELLDNYGKNIVVKEYVLSGYSQGDYSRVVAFCTIKHYIKHNSPDTTDWKDKAIQIMDGEIKEIDHWMWGQSFGYVLEERKHFIKTYDDGTTEEDEEWKEIDSCWGYYCDPDEIIKEILPNDGDTEH